MDYYSVLDWYAQNVWMLQQIFSDGEVEHSGDFAWVRITTFALPENWQQHSTKLLMILPGVEGGFTKKPDGFYLDQGLRTRSGKTPEHIFDSAGYNDLSSLSWARYSFHIKKWKPNLSEVLEGDNLLGLVDSIYLGLEKLAGKEDSKLSPPVFNF